MNHTSSTMKSTMKPSRSLSMGSTPLGNQFKSSEDTSIPAPSPACRRSLSLRSAPNASTFTATELMKSGQSEDQNMRFCSPRLRRVYSCPGMASRRQLYTISEEIPEFYSPPRRHGTWPTNSSKQLITHSSDAQLEDFPRAEDAEEEESERMSTRPPSEISYRGLGAIYIQPSPQLAGMQAVGEHLREEGDEFWSHETWTRSRAFLTQSQISIPIASYVPTGSPRTVFSNLQSPSEKNIVSRRPGSGGGRAAEWGEPSSSSSTRVNEHASSPTEWIEGYLARREEADRLEDEARRKQEKGLKWDLRRMESFSKIKRRLSAKKGMGFEPRWEQAFSGRRSFSPPLDEETSESSGAGRGRVGSFDPPLEARKSLSEALKIDLQPSSSAQPGTSSKEEPSRITPPPLPPFSPTPQRPSPWSRRSFHSINHAPSLTRLLSRKKSLGSFEPVSTVVDELRLRRSFSAKLGRRASGSAREFLSRFERRGSGSGEGKGKEVDRGGSVTDAKVVRKDSAREV